VTGLRERLSIMAVEKVVVVGSSAGGIEALQRLVAQFPADFPAAVFITQHLYERVETVLPGILSAAGRLPAKHPSAREHILPGRIYVAPPGFHLVLSPGVVTLGHGPKENLQRPCINMMFRSAAASYGKNVVGVLLTGMLDDGASGLWEIKQRGGIAVVQDPKEAAYASMPESAIRGFQVDYILPISHMGPLLETLVSGGVQVNSSGKLSDPSVPETQCDQSCPECGGVMKQQRHGLLFEYQCHIGHRFGLKTMIAEKSELVERMLSASIAQTEELIGLLKHAQSSGDDTAAASLDQEVEGYKRQVQALREVLTGSPTESFGT
jgi:two-component system chemotaxis response regulator CheB